MQIVSAKTFLALAFCLLSYLQLASTLAFGSQQNNKGSRTTSSVIKAPEGTPPLVILPGFGNDQIDYINPLEQGEEFGLVASLTKRGFSCSVVPVQRGDWLKVARGIFFPSFWKRELKPEGPCYNWYLEKVGAAVRAAAAAAPGGRVVLVGHSAGGWLARAALARRREEPPLAALVAGLVTLGSPHRAPEPPVQDMTFGCLAYVDQTYPGAYLRDRRGGGGGGGLFYLTVAGDAVEGDPAAGRRTQESYAFGSYAAVCGRGDVTGDGVVPLNSAHLDGAAQLTLPGVFHSINNPVWYGSEKVVDLWLRPLVSSLQQQKKLSKNAGGRPLPNLAKKGKGPAWLTKMLTATK
ncbi:unnamed protein product [Heterosigma akashiwo]